MKRVFIPFRLLSRAVLSLLLTVSSFDLVLGKTNVTFYDGIDIQFGGVFMQMFHDDAVWNKWATRDKTKARDYAPMPSNPELE